MRHIEPRAVTPRVLWPTLIWVLIGVEVLAILWFHVSFVPADVSVRGYVRQCTALFGSSDEGRGVVAVMQFVNTLAVLALWIAYRSARRFDGPLAKAPLAAALAGALVLAGIGWWGVKTRERCRPLDVRTIYALGADGEYRTVDAAALAQVAE